MSAPATPAVATSWPVRYSPRRTVRGRKDRLGDAGGSADRIERALEIVAGYHGVHPEAAPVRREAVVAPLGRQDPDQALVGR